MPRLETLKRSELPRFEPLFKTVEQVMGFVPNSLLTMARNPALLESLTAMFMALFGGSPVGPEPGLKALVAHVASRAAGCRYCTAHTGFSAGRAGVAGDKIAAVWSYETSPLFSDAERAALRVAQGAGATPNAVSDADFEALKQHFDDDEIVGIVGIVSVFGFLNRWNDTLATELEASPLRFGEQHLGASGWSPGKHRRPDGLEGETP